MDMENNIDTEIKDAVMNTINYVLPRFVLVLLSILLCWMLIVIYWLFMPYHVVDIKNFKVMGSVMGGQRMVYTMDYCKKSQYANYTESVQYSYSGELNYQFRGQAIEMLPPGCEEIIEALPVPRLSAGMYRLEMIRVYKVNPVREIIVRVFTPPFFLQSPKEK